MSGSQQLLLGGIPTAVPVDPYFYSVTSLLHGDGTNGGQNNTFLDSSTNNFTITRNGNTTQGSFSPFSQTGWGNYFDGTGDTLSIAQTTAMDLGSGNFTIETWIYPTSFANNCRILAKQRSSDGFGYIFRTNSTTGYLYFEIDTGGIVTSTAAPALNTWSHICVVRNSNTITIYLNGISVGSASYSGSPTSVSASAFIGSNANVNEYFVGYLSNMRFVKGSAVYTANFTPSTTPLTAITNTQLLTCQSNRFIDNSTNALAITRNGDVSVQPFSPFNPTTAYSTSAVGGSGYFDGSGDFITAPSNAAFDFGTGDFTIEAWVYRTSSGAWGTIISRRAADANFGPFTLGVSPTNVPAFSGSSTGSGWAFDIVSSSALPLNTWSHLAGVRNGNTFALYVNGTSVGTATSSASLMASSVAACIGAHANGSEPFAGYISNARIVKGTAVYTANFTPPTAPLTAITNTSLLTNFTNGAIFDNAAVADYETVGNAQISTSVKKYGTGSMYFDGTGDYLTALSNPNFAFGTGDWTVEFWVYPLAYGGTVAGAQLFGTTNGASTNYSINLGQDANTFRVISNASGTWADNLSVSTGGGPALNEWTHMAVVRQGPNLQIYKNGNRVASSTSASTWNFTGTTAVIGRFNDGLITREFNGYIDDLRISKGVARYLYNFTPPTAEFPNIGGTVTLTADPYYDYTTLLLPGNGTNGAQNNTFLDSSTNAFSITRNGNTTQGTFSPFSQTGWGVYFNGSSDYISVADSVDFTMGSGDFTVQCWVYSTANSGSDQYILGQVNSGGTAAATSFQLYKKATSNVAEAFVYAGATKVATGTAQIPVGQWTHLAMVRDGGTLRLYVNGSQDGTNATLSTTAITDSAGSFSVGRTGDYNGLYFAGYVSNVSVVKGTCLFPSGTTFTPSTTPLSTSTSGQSVLLCQANRLIDTNTATTAKTVTVGSTSSIQAFSPFNPTASWSAATNGGSGYFDGSGDYLSAPSNAAFDLGSGNFTMEAWIYPTSYGASYVLIFARYTSGGASNQPFYVTLEANGTVRAGINGTYDLQTTATAPLNAWTHVAWTRSGNDFTIWLNGISSATLNQSVTVNNPSIQVDIGAFGLLSSNYFTGYIANARIVKGTAVYTTAFTPPTTPLTAISGTSLLLNFTNAGIYDATSKNDLETVGNAQISTTQSKFGGSSMYFDGTGDWLLTQAVLGASDSGDFTVEGWFYINAAGSFYPSIQYYAATTDIAVINFNNGSSYYAALGADTINGGNAATITNASSTVSGQTWNHVAWVRYGSTITFYINGLARGTLSLAYKFQPMKLVGVSYYSAGSSPGFYQAFNGYINDLRVTKGIARYTANFTPPTTAFLTL